MLDNLTERNRTLPIELSSIVLSNSICCMYTLSHITNIGLVLLVVELANETLTFTNSHSNYNRIAFTVILHLYFNKNSQLSNYKIKKFYVRKSADLNAYCLLIFNRNLNIKQNMLIQFKICMLCAYCCYDKSQTVFVAVSF